MTQPHYRTGLNLDGSGVQDLITTGPDYPAGIALAVAGGKMYWAQSGKIRRANLDGSGVQDLITTGRPFPAALRSTSRSAAWRTASSPRRRCART